MFGQVEAQVILVEDDQAWRSRNGGETDQPGAGVLWVLNSGELVWTEDARLDPRFCDAPQVAGEPRLRFYAVHPIRLRDGRLPAPWRR